MKVLGIKKEHQTLLIHFQKLYFKKYMWGREEGNPNLNLNYIASGVQMYPGNLAN